MDQSSSRKAPPVNPCTEHDHVEGDDCPSAPFFTFGQAVKIAAPPLVVDATRRSDPEGAQRLRDPASPMARRHHGRIGIITLVERCEREMVPRMLYSVALYPAIQLRLYACELERYDGTDARTEPSVCMHGLPPDIACPECDMFEGGHGTGGAP